MHLLEIPHISFNLFGGINMSYETLYKYLPAIQSLNPDRSFTKEDLLTASFLIAQEAHIKMYYAPHNEYVNQKAKVMIVGITPGWQQMKRSEERRVGKVCKTGC